MILSAGPASNTITVASRSLPAHFKWAIFMQMPKSSSSVFYFFFFAFLCCNKFVSL